jgi:RNA polymerase sigma-70 factor (family 1)
MSAALLLSAIADTGDGATAKVPTAHRQRDDAWVDQIRKGDEQSFEALFRNYAEALVRFATSYTHDPEVAREVVNDVFVVIWERRQEWDPNQGAAAYLFSSVRHRALNAVRDRRRRDLHVQDMIIGEPKDGFVGDVIEADAAAVAESDVEEIDRILATLPPQRRQVMLLRWRYELTPEEIAEAMGMSRNAVYLALSRSLETLRRVFGKTLI